MVKRSMRMRAGTMVVCGVMAAGLTEGATPGLQERAVDMAPAVPRAIAIEPTRDLGTVGVGTDPHVSFVVRNEGRATLTLAIPKLPAGLRLLAADTSVAPGASGTVRVVLDTFRAGHSTEWVIPVATNDPQLATVDLVLRADVRTFILVTPASARFNFVQFGREGGTSHVVSAAGHAGFRVTGATPPHDFLQVRVTEAADAPREEGTEGQQWRVDVTIARDAPVGPIGGHVVIETNHPRQPRAFLPVTGFVRPLFAVTPPTVRLPVLLPSDDDGPLVALDVKNFAEDVFDVTGVRSSVTWLEPTLVVVEPGRTWKVELRAKGGVTAASPDGVITLRTASPDAPEIAVAVVVDRAAP